MSALNLKAKSKVLWLTIAVVLAALSLVFVVIPTSNKSNYAKEVAKPLEQALVGKGGIKYYENGDAGHGTDNKSPWLQEFYELPTPPQESLSIVNAIAKENGYTLTHATAQDRGPLSVADEFIDKWYYDYTHKTVHYTDLSQGPIRLAFIVDGPGSTYGSGRAIPKGHSIVGIDLALPSYK